MRILKFLPVFAILLNASAHAEGDANLKQICSTVTDAINIEIENSTKQLQQESDARNTDAEKKYGHLMAELEKSNLQTRMPLEFEITQTDLKGENAELLELLFKSAGLKNFGTFLDAYELAKDLIYGKIQIMGMTPEVLRKGKNSAEQAEKLKQVKEILEGLAKRELDKVLAVANKGMDQKDRLEMGIHFEDSADKQSAIEVKLFANNEVAIRAIFGRSYETDLMEIRDPKTGSLVNLTSAMNEDMNFEENATAQVERLERLKAFCAQNDGADLQALVEKVISVSQRSGSPSATSSIGQGVESNSGARVNSAN